MNVGISFLQEYTLKMTCMEEEVDLTTVKDRSASKVQLVVGGCQRMSEDVIKKRGREVVFKVTKDQMISTQVWRIPERGSALTS